MKPIWVSSGEPAGVGPDICLALAGHPLPLVILGDMSVLQARAAQLGVPCQMIPYHAGMTVEPIPNTLYVDHSVCPQPVIPGKLNPLAAAYVVELLTKGAQGCLTHQCSALVTAPVHKAVINQGGIPFVGHTEFFSHLTATKTVVMLLVSKAMRVSLVTTHLALRAVPEAITIEALTAHIDVLYTTLQQAFGISNPRLKVAGLNPHAGEGGYLGCEETTVIQPVIQALQQQGMSIEGPYSADTLFVNPHHCDAYVTMYHDQGLPVLKYASFGQAVNVTCGLPFIRTSVDHGTALELAGTGRAEAESLLAAVALAADMVRHREQL
jgi:4-hydroxythreonine-4-phosphate dehydrogenase